MAVKPFAFVLMPFSSEFDDVYKLGIKAAADECDVVAERVDEQSFSESILERIYRQIKNADFIIADMTGQNPNVFYEVGYAHANDKLCTLLTRTSDDIPFDLKHHRHIVYGNSIQNLKNDLKKEIEWLKSEVEKNKTETISVELKGVDGLLERTEYNAKARVEFVFDIQNRSSKKSPEIESMYLRTGKGWVFEHEGNECPSGPADDKSSQIRHFVKSPVPRMSSGAWAQIKLVGRKKVWDKWSGDELKDSYNLSGFTYLDIFTSEGNFTTQFNVDVDVDEIPF